MEKLRITVIILGSVLKMVRRPSKALAEWAIHRLDGLRRPSYSSATVLLKQSLMVSLLSVGPAMAQEQAAQEQAAQEQAAQEQAAQEEVKTTSRFLGGLCIVIGDVDSAITKRYGTSNYVVNILSKDLDRMSAARVTTPQTLIQCE